MLECTPDFLSGQAGTVDAMHFMASPTSMMRPYTDPVDIPALDLSCKKQSLTPGDSPNMSFESYSCSPSDRRLNHSFSEAESRAFMVTPPSEPESPKKMKYDGMFQQSSASNDSMGSQSSDFSMLPMNFPMAALPTVLPALLAQNSAQMNTSITSTTTNNTSQDEVVSASTTETSKRPTRPFKAYPKDPLSLSIGAVELLYDQNSNEAYSEFRKRMLESVRKTNEGTNTKMRRVKENIAVPVNSSDEKDAAYWERRRKNNEAAKRSRDARRAKEDEIAIRAAFLEQENMKLKYELVALRTETAKLRCMVFSS